MLKITGIADAEHVPLYLLQPHQCKFPVHEDWKIPGHFLFCAAVTPRGANYCTEHHERCWKSREQQKRAR